MKRFGKKLLWGAPAFLALSCAQLPTVRAAEEYENFLQGLRERGYYDVAVEYLDVMANSPLLTTTQKQMIPYEAARTNLEHARNDRDNVSREKLLDGAKAKFQEFIDKNPQHPQAAGAGTQMGVVLIERGRAKTEQGLSPQNEKQKAALMAEARKFFDESEKVFIAAEEKFAEMLKKYPKFIPQGDPLVAERERVKGDLVQAHMFHAKGMYEKSRTYPEDSEDRKKALVAAADKYGQIYRDYRTLIAGLAARLQEGQCYQELKDTKRALGLYNDLLSQPDGPEMKPLRPYKASALYLSLQCWTADTEKLYELASLQAEEFLKGSNAQELQRPEWLAVRYYGAIANKLFAATFGESPKGEDEKKQKKALDDASDYAQVVASTPGEYQDMARGLLREMGASVDPTREPKNFLEAQTRGMEEMTKYTAALAEAMKPFSDEANKDAKVKETEIAAKDAKQKESDAARESAMNLFYKALALADNTTNIDDKNQVRYYICYLLYTQNKLYDAAVIGEFLLKFYPSSGGARSAAQIALAAYVNEYQLNQELKLSGNGNVKPIEEEFDRKRMYAIASEIATRWKNDKEADDAWNILLAIAINEKNIPEILKSLENIKETATMRSDAEMSAATALWAQYSLQMTLDEGDPQKKPAAEMMKLATDTNAILEKTFAREKGRITDVGQLTLKHADALRYLVESRIAIGKNAEALAALKDPTIGLLTLVEKKAPAATPLISLEAFKLALQAYVLNNQVTDAQALIGKVAEFTGPQAPGAASAQDQLAGTYLNLALRIDKQIEQYRGTQNFKGIADTVDGFAFFLDQVQKAYLPQLSGTETPEQRAEALKPLYAKTPAEQTMAFQNANWAADQLYKVGTDLLSQPNAPDADKARAVTLLTSSGRISDTLGHIAKQGSDEQLIVRLRKARALRQAGKYSEAVAALADVLYTRRNLMEAQVEAAETMMARAAANPKDPKEAAFYARAIDGYWPDPATKENIIWGWKRIADTMRRIPEFQQPKDGTPDAKAQHEAYRKLFHTGRYNMADCYYRHALTPAATADERTKFLNSVTYSNGITKDFDPTMGGPEWQAKYQDLSDKAARALKQ